MKFEKLLHHLDMGVCVDQQQREALVDLVILFVEIDGVIDSQEMEYTNAWLSTIKWNSAQDTVSYLKETSAKCQTAIATDCVEDYIRHRAEHIIDHEAQNQAIKLAEGVALADGELAPIEARAIAYLKKCFS